MEVVWRLVRRVWRSRCLLGEREQALGALDALIQVLGPVAGPQVRGLVEGLLPQKPASPVPTTPTHAEVVARLHVLYDSEKKGKKKVEEAQGRLETARAQVLQAEEGMTRADGEFQVIQKQRGSEGTASEGG